MRLVTNRTFGRAGSHPSFKRLPYIALLYEDESEALSHPYLAHAWAPRGADLRVSAPGQSRKVAILGVLDTMMRELIVHTSATKRRTDFIALVEKLDARFGPRPGKHIPNYG